MRQNYVECSFSNTDSWLILSSIERSIKQKIETMGTPLKDWDINIYRGVLTGYNDAFIISTEKREEILENCQTEEERSKTAELIRPILRGGRDIKRYGYDWNGLYLIATFPSCHYDIEMFPAIKKHLLTFGDKRLEQTGEIHIINGKKVKARKKTNNKWFETQDSISYWEDFFKPKILWKRVGSILRFCYDDNQSLGLDSSFMITGKHVSFLTAFLNSSLFKFCFRENFPELLGGTRELRKIFFDKISVLKVSDEIDIIFRNAIVKIQSDYTKEQAIAIDNLLFDLYNLTDEERKIIGYIEIT